ncbi:MAG TPA: YebC/PmpR family DNA-binding transcriptional regulator [Steroidobacteraceae bacterium]|nr:YebC/PmpR family DNA-binding transcriptional regulator [Steroidobacteraceae bacterium]
MMGHSNWANLQRRARAATRCRHAAAEPCDGHEIVQYEGYGPGGGVLMVECVTADPKRMGAEVRRTFHKHGGQLGADGSVAYLFNTVGLLTYPPGTDEEQLMQAALEAGAEDVVPNADTSVEVLADPFEFGTVRAMLTHQGFAPATAEVTRRAGTSLALAGEDAEAMLQLLEALEGLADVRGVYSNVEISDEVLSRCEVN